MARSIDDLRPLVGRCVLVPTMGALHDGHVALVRRGVELADRRGLPGGCVVSVFVNPTQFDDPSDLDRYPRTLEADQAACATAGAAAVFAPGVDEVYPDGAESALIDPPPPGVGKGLEDEHRPGHFAGVCTVLSRLFELIRPIAAVFGEKDWQQLVVTRALVDRDGLGVEIIGEPTVREADGLAMSSRNRFIPDGRREAALSISRALRAAGAEQDPPSAERAMRDVLIGGGVDSIDYAVVRDARTLGPVTPDPLVERRALITARVGPVRLLDNAAWIPTPA
ncbi:MAG: pantoate--beta-alanine ligase [Phycisphaerae bacterium]|nr:pantoate--beta-alanine ligase [Phycisphaerae bacterium]